MKTSIIKPEYYCRVKQSKSGLYYGYYNGRIITDGTLTAWGCKRQIKKNFSKGASIKFFY